MLIVTSLVYVLLYAATTIAHLLLPFMFSINLSRDAFVVLYKCAVVVNALVALVFAYNFYVYLITGKRFRSELHTLFSCCLSFCSSSSSYSGPAATAVSDDAEVAKRGQTETTV